MVTVREPVLKPVSISDLRPTQITVGVREVNAKRKGWREKEGKKGGEFLGKHMIPVIRGPGNRLYIIDHHHLARFLHEEGVKDVLVEVMADLSMVDRDAFWTVLDNRNWMHPFDDRRRGRDYKGYSEIGARPRRRSVSFASRGIEARRGIRERYDGQRISMGGLSAASNQT
jgi:hypothetical protein